MPALRLIDQLWLHLLLTGGERLGLVVFFLPWFYAYFLLVDYIITLGVLSCVLLVVFVALDRQLVVSHFLGLVRCGREEEVFWGELFL